MFSIFFGGGGERRKDRPTPMNGPPTRSELSDLQRELVGTYLPGAPQPPFAVNVAIFPRSYFSKFHASISVYIYNFHQHHECNILFSIC